MNMDTLMSGLYENRAKLMECAGLEVDNVVVSRNTVELNHIVPHHTATINSNTTGEINWGPPYTTTSDRIILENREGDKIEIDGEIFTAEDVRNWKKGYECLEVMAQRIKSLEVTLMNLDLKDVKPMSPPIARKQSFGAKCECGTDKSGVGGLHSDWCPKFERW